MGRIGCGVVMSLLLAGSAHAKEPAPEPATQAPDAMAQALEAMGLTEADLGYRPKGWLPRYPHASTVPFVMPFFEDLFATPLDTYAFARTLGNAVEDWLTVDELVRGKSETLFKLGVALGTERRIGGMRRFRSGADSKATGVSVGEAAPEALRSALDAFLSSLAEAKAWIDRGLRHVTPTQRDSVFDDLPEIADNTSDGTKYYETFGDVARAIDEHALHHGCLRALQATQNARRALGVALAKGPPQSFVVTHDVLGGVWVGTADKLDDDVRTGKYAIVVLFGVRPSDCTHLGFTQRGRTLSVALLIQPDDSTGKSAPAESLPTERSAPHLASGILGCGIVYAAGNHDDLWKAGSWSQGAGCFGMGVLLDEGGNDRYEVRNMGQGAAYFGAGLLLDASGNDVYALREGDGQAMGGPGGIGVLADRAGNDHYYVESDPKKAGRADYHSEDTVSSNMAQGAGMGRRGDISDGHAWAGGLGALLDVDGDDTYEAGNFTQGIGYWFGTGLLWDGGGNDRYLSVYFTQGSGAHFAIGALIDESGNDTHTLSKTAGAGLGFGWDVVNAFLIDRGSGNDVYEAKNISIAVAQVRSNAFFLDEGGSDTYVLSGSNVGIGNIDARGYYTKPDRTSPMHYVLPQVAVFLDLGADVDTYKRLGKDGQPIADALEGNDQTWRVRTRDPKSRAGFNTSIGRDGTRGRLGFLDDWPARVSTPAPPSAVK